MPSKQKAAFSTRITNAFLNKRLHSVLGSLMPSKQTAAFNTSITNAF